MPWTMSTIYQRVKIQRSNSGEVHGLIPSSPLFREVLYTLTLDFIPANISAYVANTNILLD